MFLIKKNTALGIFCSTSLPRRFRVEKIKVEPRASEGTDSTRGFHRQGGGCDVSVDGIFFCWLPVLVFLYIVIGPNLPSLKRTELTPQIPGR